MVPPASWLLGRVGWLLGDSRSLAPSVGTHTPRVREREGSLVPEEVACTPGGPGLEMCVSQMRGRVEGWF